MEMFFDECDKLAAQAERLEALLQSLDDRLQTPLSEKVRTSLETLRADAHDKYARLQDRL